MNYKKSDGRTPFLGRNRRNYITDYDHNRMVDLITGFKQYDSYPKRLRVFSSDASTLMTLIQRNFSGQYKDIEVAREGGNNPFVRIFFNSKDSRIALENKLRELKAQGKIVVYTDTGGTTEDGSNIDLTGTPQRDTRNTNNNGNNNNNGGGTGMNWTTILIVGAVVFAGIMIFKKKK